jgi:hypothetical protein
MSWRDHLSIQCLPIQPQFELNFHQSPNDSDEKAIDFCKNRDIMRLALNIALQSSFQPHQNTGAIICRIFGHMMYDG